MKRIRNFSKIARVAELPDLLEMQKQSYRDFLQEDIKPQDRDLKGLQSAFVDVFPINSADNSMVLDFVRYELVENRYSREEEARAQDANFQRTLKVVLRLSSRQPSGKLNKIVEQDVVLCEVPLMTETGSFIISGAERVVVSQLHRSPGIVFEEDDDKKISVLGRKLFTAKIIPYRGAWIEFEFDVNNALFIRIDRKKKFPVTTFLRACGMDSQADILQTFFRCDTVAIFGRSVDEVKAELLRRISAEDVVDKATGEILVEAGDSLTHEKIDRMIDKKISGILLLGANPDKENPAVWESLRKDATKNQKEAQQEIYKKLRGQEFIVPGQAEEYLDNLLFKTLRRYDLSKVGRYKILKKLGFLFEWLKDREGLRYQVPADKTRTLMLEDLLATIKYLILLNNGDARIEYKGTTYPIETDDIDHLGNRRVRGVGELLKDQIRIGLTQMSRVIRDRMSVQDKAQLTPRSLVNAAPLVGMLRKFFGTSQLSQFMDQINPLAELTHKRRLSALGPGGLNRKRAGFEVRDVHPTHYGRICPIETPEGPNIGLITTLASMAKVNEYGLIESPYLSVNGRKVSDKAEYLAADIEDGKMVAQANAELKGNTLSGDYVAARHQGDFKTVSPKEIDFMDVSPLQVVSVSSALIPFLAHDDANRALMGANMQRQAVPLMITEQAVVATGIEETVARDSGACIRAKRAGKVLYSSGDVIAVAAGGKDVDLYELRKYRRSNQDTCVNQVPLVRAGDSVKKGDSLADGPATSEGQLALGKNILVGFMPWEGYNYEDAVLISERLVKEDVFTSIHISEFEIEARDTKLGPEEITRDIPNVGADALEYLDENGIVVPSTNVRPGDILVGKVTPKGEQQLTPEERLLKVIFGKKAEDVQDASLKVPPGVRGKVIGVRTFVRREKLTKQDEKRRLNEVDARLNASLSALKEYRKEQNEDSAKGKGEDERLKVFFNLMEKRLKDEAARDKEGIKQGDDLPVTVNKIVKVYVASKRKIQAGDKIAGRHGNKGIIAKVLPVEDMPFMPDGTPLDMVLSPLGVPSRMNVGQLLEVMLGWAAKTLDVQTYNPVFDSATEQEVVDMIGEGRAKLKEDLGFDEKAAKKYLPDEYCRVQLYDGRTGDPFEEKTTIGYMYIIKLNHMVEDKIHARSTGPYSLITRQPLGGKAQFGGQRFGEMEVWAIEGYGAANALQEFLTVKSDDVTGRTKMYEAIIKGEPPQAPGVPESFKVLIKELQALGLSVDLLKQPVPSNGAKSDGEKKKAVEAKA
ncbi:MAG: DNA-directed RNA polymerase subunit beta [Elusimicrobia bacterium CG_4_9_14_3_um_filter_62_55]|nr:MAG: DNA-directed RNA polymerase subunit beta [Elusimicrobia bacterium CG22_combo_CG10-13_8_21_14_all_63_91]PJA17067.1 MAG: DNA-directed RNA polymerase subunit beta [Elusimicrobia bacterium CG_4_10_14_0_2_um_filter_63_34]PJB25098.1 MAG: DNA-directed RNA polymerase subunit beta [Elusimicrobia bacterium CG_4_9_14_3_um_filter_62_55]